MRSHFSLNRGVATACAVAGATTLLHGNCSAQNLIAADYATNSTYAGGWSAGQNGGYGFGAWSFDGTDPTPAGQYQGIGTTSPIGTAWTLLTHANHTGIADAGRAIMEPGGLQVGQTFETVIENPIGYYFYRGFDLMLLNGTNNDFSGINTSAIRMQFFAYYNRNTPFWSITDDSGDTLAPLNLPTTGAAGLKVGVTLTSTNTYLLTMTPLSNPASAYTQSGTLTTNLPINWVNFRLYWGTSSGLTDPTNNFAMSSMTISGLQLNIQKAGSNVILSWTTNVPGFNLMSTPQLGTGAVWSPVSPAPVVINNLNVVTNSIIGNQQYYRLQQ
jgi:hypothetical protein